MKNHYTIHEPEIKADFTKGLYPTPIKIDLRNLESIRREMSRVYREMRAQKIKKEDGTKLVYVLSCIAKLTVLELIEPRIIDLEKKLLK